MSVVTLGNLCISRCNSSNVAWCPSDRVCSFNHIIFFNTAIDVCKYFAHLMKNALTSFKNLIPMMPLSLAYCSPIVPINILLKFFNTSGPSRSIFSTSSDSEITSGRMNLESNERYKRYTNMKRCK